MSETQKLLSKLSPVDVFPKKDLTELMRIGRSRTHNFALETIRPYNPVTIQDALAAAYIQGMADALIIGS